MNRSCSVFNCVGSEKKWPSKWCPCAFMLACKPNRFLHWPTASSMRFCHVLAHLSIQALLQVAGVADRCIVQCTHVTASVHKYCTGCFKKSSPLKLFGIFSLRLSLFMWNFVNLLAIHIHSCVYVQRCWPGLLRHWLRISRLLCSFHWRRHCRSTEAAKQAMPAGPTTNLVAQGVCWRAGTVPEPLVQLVVAARSRSDII